MPIKHIAEISVIAVFKYYLLKACFRNLNWC